MPRPLPLRLRPCRPNWQRTGPRSRAARSLVARDKRSTYARRLADMRAHLRVRHQTARGHRQRHDDQSGREQKEFKREKQSRAYPPQGLIAHPAHRAMLREGEAADMYAQGRSLIRCASKGSDQAFRIWVLPRRSRRRWAVLGCPSPARRTVPGTQGLLMDMDFAVRCLLVRRSRLVSGSCPSTRTFAPRFLQTSPRGDSPCASLTLHLHQVGWRTCTSWAPEHALYIRKPLAR